MSNSAKSKQQVNEHVMALITYLALVPLVYFIPDYIGQFLPAIKWVNVVVVVGVMVLIISYGVMPIARFVLSR